MPELPEVETIARGLAAVLPGRVIARAALTAPDLYRRGSRRMGWIRGARVRSVERIGKAIRFDLESAGGERVMVSHLGMTGRFVFEKRRAGGAPPLHRHGRWVFADGAVLEYIDPRRFGYFYLAPPGSLREALNMGPDPFEIRPRDLERVFAGRRTSVKALLLNQRLIAGMGNIYVDEALFLARVHPLTPAGEAVDRARTILDASRRVLRRAIRFSGTTLRDYRRLDGDTGGFGARLRVYGRDGERCVRCGSVIERVVVVARGTHFCPSCQPLTTRR